MVFSRVFTVAVNLFVILIVIEGNKLANESELENTISGECSDVYTLERLGEIHELELQILCLRPKEVCFTLPWQKQTESIKKDLFLRIDYAPNHCIQARQFNLLTSDSYRWKVNFMKKCCSLANKQEKEKIKCLVGTPFSGAEPPFSSDFALSLILSLVFSVVGMKILADSLQSMSIQSSEGSLDKSKGV